MIAELTTVRSGRVRALLASLVALTLVLAGCSAGAGSGTGSSGSGKNDSVTIGLAAEPASLDFSTSDGAAIPQALLYNVYETLVKLDDNGQIKPALAKQWTVSPDRLTYTFTLADNATFANGQKFTANDAVFSINRVKKDWTISLKKGMDVVADAKALSDTQLQVTLSKPSNGWLYKMTSRIGAMMTESGAGSIATKPIGTGPYQLDSWQRGDSITLKARPEYWGTKPRLQQVTLKYFKDPTALNSALLSGAIDVVGTVQAPESLKQFEGNGKFQVIQGTSNGEVLLSMNNARAPFNNLQARQAVRYAIDHKALLDTCWAGRGDLIGGMVPPTDPWYEDLTGLYPYDPAKAKALLAQSGQAKTPIRLRLPSLPYATSCGQVVKSMLEQAGFTVQLDQLEFPAAWLATVFKGGDYEMSIVNHVEPRDIATVFGDPSYYVHYSNQEAQSAFAAADQAPDDQYVGLMKTAARAVSEDAASDPLFLFPNLVVAKKEITGLPKNSISESFDLTGLSRS